MPRVLTIEDDAVTAREIAAELQRRGLTVDLADNGRKGLERAATATTTPSPWTACCPSWTASAW